MAKCPTCGKEFSPCRTTIPGAWNWRQHACSLDCANAYIKKIEAARAEARKQQSSDKDTK